MLYNPSSRHITFADLRYACKSKVELDKQRETSFPYNISFTPQFLPYKDSHPMRDRWSLGLILLEMLIGEELVLGQESYDELKELYEMVSKHIGEATVFLLDHLLDFYELTSLREYVVFTLNSNPEAFAAEMRAMDAAIPDDYELSRLR